MPAHKKPRIAVVGTESLQGKEIKSALESRRVGDVDFFDPDVDEEFSKLTQFCGEARAILRLTPDSVRDMDLVFLAADQEISVSYGAMAEEKGFLAVDLSGSFVQREDVPLLVAGVNDDLLSRKKPAVISNPHPVSIILSHIISRLDEGFGLKKIISCIFQPASAFDESGIQELADQSAALLSSSSLPKDVFGEQVAFNLLPHMRSLKKDGFSEIEGHVMTEIERILGSRKTPFSLSFIQVPVFHTYSIMSFLELETDATLKRFKELMTSSSYFKQFSSTSPVTSVTVAGKEEIFIGRIKKDRSFPNSFWVWTVADNLTRGSALNALEIAQKALAVWTREK